MKGVDERIDESVLPWLVHIERMGNDRIAKRVYVEECVGNHSVDLYRKMWINSVNEALKNRCLNVGQEGEL